MRRRCKYTLPKRLDLSIRYPGHANSNIIVTHLSTSRRLPPVQDREIKQPATKIPFYNVPSPLKPSKRDPSPSPPTTAEFFVLLSRLLSNPHVHGTTLWHFVKISYVPSRLKNPGALTQSQQQLLSQVLKSVFQEWAAACHHKETIQPFNVLRNYVACKLITREDWVYCLGCLARTTYLNIDLHQTRPPEDALAGRVYDSINLRTLCKAWKLFLVGFEPKPKAPFNRPNPTKLLWDRLRDEPAQTGDEQHGTDYVQKFMRYAGIQNSPKRPDLDRHLAYTSILTLFALYSSLRHFAIDSANVSANASAAEQVESSNLQPNWHLGPGQKAYWTPEIGHLSISEASFLYIVARATHESTLNITLLMISTAHMLSPKFLQEIARISQAFKLAAPTILEKCSNYEEDRNVYEAGLLRRYPLRSAIRGAVVSSDIEALENAGATMDYHGGPARTAPGDALALVQAFMQVDLPVRAIHYWNSLNQQEELLPNAWHIWLSYASEKEDGVAFEIAWDMLGSLGIQRISRTWCRRRLVLLDKTGHFSDAWTNFCALVRYSGQNRLLLAKHLPRIAPRLLDVEVFHTMIRICLERGGELGEEMSKAEQTLVYLQAHLDLEATRATYMLFIEDSMRRGLRQSAIDWFSKAKAKQITFLPQDYALLIEHELESWPSSDRFSNIRRCFDHLAPIMRLVRGSWQPAHGTHRLQPVSPDMEKVLLNMPQLDRVDDDPAEKKMEDIQSLYAGLVQHFAHGFAEQPPGCAKMARLTILLFLWDHCVMTSIPPSTEMYLVLHSIIHGMSDELQEELMSGALFDNYNAKNALSFASCRFLRLIGPLWFTERISSIPPGPVKSQLARLPWRGYDAVTDEALAAVGIASEEDRQKILDEVQSWKDIATRGKDEQRAASIAEFESEFPAEKYDDVAGECRLSIERQTEEICHKRETIFNLKKKLEAARSTKDAARREVFLELRSMNSGPTIEKDLSKLDEALEQNRQLQVESTSCKKQEC
jgi:hypothetical protein